MRDMERKQVFQELAEEELREAQEARIREELQMAVQKRIDLRLAMAHQQKERVAQLHREAQREQQERQEVTYGLYIHNTSCFLKSPLTFSS